MITIYGFAAEQTPHRNIITMFLDGLEFDGDELRERTTKDVNDPECFV